MDREDPAKTPVAPKDDISYSQKVAFVHLLAGIPLICESPLKGPNLATD